MKCEPGGVVFVELIKLQNLTGSVIEKLRSTNGIKRVIETVSGECCFKVVFLFFLGSGCGLFKFLFLFIVGFEKPINKTVVVCYLNGLPCR